MVGRHGIVAAGLLPYLRLTWLTTLRYTLPQRVGLSHRAETVFTLCHDPLPAPFWLQLAHRS